MDYSYKVWQYRRLIVTFALRDLKIQYAQTILGLLWSVIQPLTALAIFTIFFSKLIQIPGIGEHYSLFAFSGLLIWNNYSYIMGKAGTSLMENQHIIKKIYFPKLILPLSKVLVSWVEFLISFSLLVVLMLILKVPVTVRLMAVPLALLLNAFMALSVAVWLGALTVKYRDFHQLVPFIVSFGIWLTPVFYPVTIIPAEYSFITYFNPVAGVIALLRWIVTGTTFQVLNYVPVWLFCFLLLLAGCRYFIQNEKTISDTI
jgi:lipopolysaccharide transport system permease protein